MPITEFKGQSNWFNPPGSDEMDDVITCSKCNCKWMELILVQQYPKFHSVILGQKPSPKGEIGFWIFRCPKCGETYEPSVQVGPRDSARKGYDQFLDCMLEGKE